MIHSMQNDELGALHEQKAVMLRNHSMGSYARSTQTPISYCDGTRTLDCYKLLRLCKGLSTHYTGLDLLFAFILTLSI